MLQLFDPLQFPLALELHLLCPLPLTLLAHELVQPLPGGLVLPHLLHLARQLLTAASAAGYGREDFSALAKVVLALAGAQ